MQLSTRIYILSNEFVEPGQGVIRIYLIIINRDEIAEDEDLLTSASTLSSTMDSTLAQESTFM